MSMMRIDSDESAGSRQAMSGFISANGSTETEHGVCLVIVWYGEWPNWFRYFLRSCARNHRFHWLIFTENAPPENCPENVRVIELPRLHFEKMVGDRLGCDYRFSYGYKLCDLKPVYGHIFEEWLAPYRFWGYCDVDVIFGDLSRFLTLELLERSDVVTSSKRILVGHFTILRNTSTLRLLYQQVPDFVNMLADPEYRVFDEAHFSDQVKSLSNTAAIHLNVVPMVQEDTLVWWAGRPGFLILWWDGELWDILIGPRIGYFHFIKTKYQRQLVNRSGGAGLPVQAFAVCNSGLFDIDNVASGLRFACLSLYEFLRTIPWYIKISLKRLLPVSARASLRRLLGK